MSTAAADHALGSTRFEQHDDNLDGIRIRYWASADGHGKPPLLMLHGSGPGASTHGNWRLVIGALADHFQVIATDLVGFGQSGRKTASPYFDYDLWVRQAGHVLRKFTDERSVNVLGHSLSGSISLKLAALDSRVGRVMTTGTLGARFEANRSLEVVWSFPRNEDELVEAGKTLVFDPSLITPAYIEGRKKILYTGDYEAYFRSMFDGNKQRFVDAAVLSDDDVSSIRCPVLLVHGRDDLPTPPIASRDLANRLRHADLVELAECGHSIALEHPRKFVELARSFFLAW